MRGPSVSGRRKNGKRVTVKSMGSSASMSLAATPTSDPTRPWLQAAESGPSGKQLYKPGLVLKHALCEYSLR